MARSGYTLPVFACATAIAAIEQLRSGKSLSTVTVNLVNPENLAVIEIEQVAPLNSQSALGITRSDPGDNLDITRNTPIWAMVTIRPGKKELVILGGEGIGKNQNNQATIYRYAYQLFKTNLEPYLLTDETLEVTIILPEGRALAQRTSNEAFGIVEGLSLLGTSGISQPLSAVEHLETLQQEIRERAEQSPFLVFCIGENGLHLAQKKGFPIERLVKTANWLGPLLVTAAIAEVKQILLFGYHGKLIKLAGGIFHTHHHLADARLEILVAQAAKIGLPTAYLQQLLTCETTEAALQQLHQWDTIHGSHPQETPGHSSPTWVKQIYHSIAETIDQRTQRYIRDNAGKTVQIGSILFDRDRQIIVSSSEGEMLQNQLIP